MKAQRLNGRHIPVALFALLISLDTAVRLLEKTAVVGALLGVHTSFAFGLLKQPWWWLGLALGPFQLWTWMRILARTELNVAYSLSSLSYPLTMIAAWRLFNEHLGWQVWLGGFFMTVGVALVGSTAVPSPISQVTQPSMQPER